MKNSSITKKALLTSILSLFVCFTMLVGTTFAWFTDTVTSDKNTIVAGNLDIELEYYTSNGWQTVEGASDIFDPNALWEPGYTEVAYFHIKNAGSLALKYSFVINVVKPGAGINVYGDEFELADYIQYSIVEDVNGKDAPYANRADAFAAATAAGEVPRQLGDHTAERVTSEKMLSGEDKYFAVVLWMPTEVDNEANYKKGTPAPVVELGVTVMATQTPHESDSFDDQYDKDLKLDWGIGTATKTPGITDLYVEASDGAGYKMGYAHVPVEAMAADKISMTMEKIELDKRIPVASGETALTYEVSLDGIVDGNTHQIKVGLEMPKGLDSNYIKIYHEDQPIALEAYNATLGYIEFLTTGFSPFTIVYDETKLAPTAPDGDTIGLKAEVTPQNQYENVVITWEGYNGINPADLTQKLETTYLFKAPHDDDTVGSCEYKDWACDYVVSIDRDIPAGALTLGGNYGEFGWVGFENPMDVKANEEIYLLGSVLEGSSWTYEGIATWVGEFICGVAKANDTDADLEGATFTVMLRVTSPEGKYYNVNTVTYTFGNAFGNGVSVIDGVRETN